MTLKELIRGLRLRLSEVDDDDGLWSDEDLTDYLNDAQVVIARDCHSTVALPWSSTHKHTIPVVSGTDRYYMPDDFIAPESIAHFRDGYKPRKLIKKSIKDIRLNTYHYGYDTLYAYYEIRGKDSPFVAQGVASDTSENKLIDTRGSFTQVRIGDVVHNTTDNSTAEVKGFSDGSIDLDRWIGGTSHKFYAGDGYKVQQAERDTYLCWVWPIQALQDPIAYQGDPHGNGGGFMLGDSTRTGVNSDLAQDRVINSVQLRFDNLPKGWQEDNRVTIVVHDEQGNLADERLESIFSARIRLGYNDIPISGAYQSPGVNEYSEYNEVGVGRTFRLRQNIKYFVKAYIDIDEVRESYPDDMPFNLQQELNNRTILREAEGGIENFYLNMKEVVLRYNNGDYIEVSYVPRPRRMTNDRSISEFPEEAKSVIYAYAKMLAMQKKDPDGRMQVAQQNIYENQLEHFKEYLMLIEESGNDVLGGERALHHLDTPGFTEFYGDI